MDLRTEVSVDSGEGLIGRRPRSANRLRYDAEIRLIQTKLGNLEEIRSKLGLSRRKICQLLLVDPSAWSRWTSPGGDAPPHIYRALEWYILLTEKDPRALLPMGTWSSTAFEDRFKILEARLHQMSRSQAGRMAAVLVAGIAMGVLLILAFR